MTGRNPERLSPPRPAPVAKTAGAATPVRAAARSVRFTAGTVTGSGTGTTFYDAAQTPADMDWGTCYAAGHFEDFLFTGSIRRKVLGRLRREVRNNPYLAGLVNKYPEAVGTTSLRSRTKDPAYNDAKERFHHRWGKRITLTGLSQRAVEEILVQELLLAGELFIVLLQNGLVQLVPSEFCGTPYAATRFGDRELNGIVYRGSATDSRAAFFRFGKMDRFGRVEFTGRDDELVQARNVIHVYNPDRVHMGRGLPWLLASIPTARNLYEITRSKTKQIKDANSFSGAIVRKGGDFLESMNAARQAAQGLSETLPTESTAEAGESADSPADSVQSDRLKIELYPGMFIELEEGEDLKQLMSQYNAEDYKELIMLMLHAISSPVGLPVELWFSGLGDVNYSGFKGLGVQWKSRRKRVCAFLEDTFLERLQFWRTMKAKNEGDLTDAEGNPYTPPEGMDDSLVEFGWQRAAVLDDEKAAQSNQRRLASGESHHGEVWADGGRFPEEVLEERRQFYLQLLIAAGELEAGTDAKTVKVPKEFLLYNRLPGGVGPESSGSGKPTPSKNEEEEEDDDAKTNREAA